jgi:hypothetical protein
VWSWKKRWPPAGSTEFNGETTVLVNPARARVVYLALRPEIEVRSGMPDHKRAPEPADRLDPDRLDPDRLDPRREV